jgi:hypothetical protein
MRKIALLLMLVVLIIVGSIESMSAQDMALKTNLLYDATSTINIGYEAALNHRTTLDIWVNYNPWSLGRKMVGLDDEAVMQVTGASYTGGTAEYRDRKLKHILIQPEVRWWLCEKFNGHFFGAHLHGGIFNVGAINLFGWGDYGIGKSGQPLLRRTHMSSDEFNALTPDQRKQYYVTGVQYRPGTDEWDAYPGMKNPEKNDFLWRNADRDGIYTNSFEGWFIGAGVSYGYHWLLGRRFSMEFTLGIGYAYLDYEKSRCTECKKKLGEGVSHYFGPTRAGISLVYMLK